MKVGNQSNFYLDNALKNSQKALGNIAATRAISGVDSANLVIADSLASRASGIEAGIANANDAIGMLGIADSVLGNLTQNSDRLVEIGVRLNSASLDNNAKMALKNEAQSLVTAMRDSVTGAKFNGSEIFGRNLEFQTGNGNESINLQRPNFNSLDVENLDSIRNFAKNINTIRGEVGSTQNAIHIGITNSLSQFIGAKASESNLLNDDLAKNVMDFDKSNFDIAKTTMVLAHQNNISKENVARLLS